MICESCCSKTKLKFEVSQLLGNVAAATTGSQFWRNFFLKQMSVCVFQQFSTLISAIERSKQRPRNQRMLCDDYLINRKATMFNCRPVCGIRILNSRMSPYHFNSNRPPVAYCSLRYPPLPVWMTKNDSERKYVEKLEKNKDTCLYFPQRERVKKVLVKMLENMDTSSETSKQIDENGMFQILYQIKSELSIADSENGTNEVQSSTGENSVPHWNLPPPFY